MLEGFDQHWRTTTNRLVEYTNLRPGNYRFRVRLANAEPDNSDLEAVLLLTVTPLYWQTPWFIAAMILTALGLIAVTFRLRTRYLYQRQLALQKIVDLRTHEIQSNHTLLKKSHEQLAALNQEKNEILSIVAHDLRNPLGSIESITQLLEEDIRKGNKLQALEWLGTQLSSVKQARGLVDQLLNDNKIEQGLIMASIQTVDVSAVFREIALSFKRALLEKQLRLDTSGIPVDSVWVAADPVLLRQALENLLSNAIKFSHFGKAIWLEVESSGDSVRLKVRDEGPGLSLEDRRKLFARYSRLSARPTAGESSLGLGLSIASKMVKLMGGRIGCDSELGKGAVFWIELAKSVPSAGQSSNQLN